ncbi:MAG TPA: cation diffusion facilitator family transporter [Actinomycetota bacterium]|nr:cation diffusion facilitator family transporter [Actinomycetota bacterium]
MSAADSHAPATSARATRAARAADLALSATVVLALGKLVVWLLTGSLVVLSQALDSALDVFALGLLYFALRIATRPADETHHYGHGKAENLAAYTQTLLLGAAVIAVVVQAVRGLSDGHDVEAPVYALAALGISVIIDVIRVRLLIPSARREASPALAAAALNVATDIGTAVVALVSLVAVRAGFEQADAIGALIVAAAVTFAGFRLGKSSVDVLMDYAPQTRAAAIEAAAGRARGVAETRRVRVRGSGEQLFADVTVAAGRTASLERAHDIAEQVEKEIARVAPGVDVVVHVEPTDNTGGLVERVQAAASRIEDVHEVHNVLVHSFREGGETKLHVTLHAKVAPGTSLGGAHDLSDRIEAAVESELGMPARVDTHIEPLQPTTVGTDVTADHSDLVQSVRIAALEEPDVRDCHDVVITSANGELTVVAHLTGRADLPLARMHEASERIEKAVHARHPEIGPVVLHFEPAT